MHYRDAQAAFEPTPMPRQASNVIPFRRISTEEMADDLRMDVLVINDRLRQYESDVAALTRLRDTKAEQLELCIRALGRKS